ncbi:amino acid adenylation domain-containing protein [Modestobacter sp. I12A-02628]|uniref:Amino acid adenylation domain-containing protein n=1 Tax=Goekera deserti TaxID=2497753 RepID=A0A7K3WD83_9ACTN|nr:non-ribosomal peptide synthetase [Goekera deserti]MPQ96902.1 amino acid adenylation domain-containing protein [Goekera deserti]NDI46785.1 amino acid adenylation domain-containing protein [Goekera deserti]NEL54354.1 amino acid adenylation domain-containing protein [Goekera deserti]
MDDHTVQGFRTSPVQRFLAAPTSDDGGACPPCPWVQATVEVDAEVDQRRLDRALRSVWERHEALRTRVVTRPGLPEAVQVVDDIRTFTVEESAGDPDDRSGSVARLREDERRLVEPALRSVRVLRVGFGAEGAALLVTGSAATVDERSLGIVLDEVFAAYRGESWPDEPVQYPDASIWQHEVLTDADRSDARERWADALRLEAASPLPSILLSGRAPGEWRRIERPYDQGTQGFLDRFAEKSGSDRAEVAAGAWLALQLLLLGERDMVAGVTVAGRGPAELADAVGPFEREVPLQLHVPEGTTFRQFLDLVRSAWQRAADDVDDLDPARRSGPVAASVSASIGEAVPHGAHAGVRSIRLDGRGGAPLHMRLGASTAVLDHDAGRLPESSAQVLLNRTLHLLATVAADPDIDLDELSLLLPGEPCAAPAAVGPPAGVPEEPTLSAVVAARAAAAPDAPAVDDGRTSLTYTELVRRSDEVAGLLREAGVTAGSHVVLSMPRCSELLVGLLGIMRAGAVYVPVDADAPASRLQTILADVGARVLVRGPETIVEVEADSDGAAPAPGVRIIRIDAMSGTDGGATPLPDAVPQDCDAGAYVLYTSGSTGVPNGVPVTHRALLNYLGWAAEAYRLHEGRGAIVHSPIGFDLSLTTMLAPLMVGQRVRLARGSGIQGLLDAIRVEDDISLVKVTPAQIPALLEGLGDGEFGRRVRTLVCGGEGLFWDAVTPVLEAGVRVVNEYGPTETVVGCTAYAATSPAGTGPVPIGQPIAGTAVHLLDRRGHAVPQGGVGELVVAGVAVGTGYLGRPEETSRRFVADPGGGESRAYRTGDRVRWLANGDLVYLGRMDEQLKVLGIRVEPGEVEAVLRRHPAVAEAAVVGLIPPAGGPPTRLGAQVVLTAGASVTGAALVAHCRALLPAGLVPAVVAPVPRLPLTTNAKLDRAAVREALQRSVPEVEHVEPRDRTETILCTAVAQVLRRNRVGIDDNYFAIGGDSIRSVMVASRAAAEGVPVAVVDLHRWPTIRALAAELSTRPAAEAAPATAPFGLIDDADRRLMPEDVEDAFPLNLLQQGMIFHRNFAAKSAVYHAIASVRIHAPLDLQVMREVIRQLVARHPMLRTSFDQRTFSRPLQLVHGTFRDPLGFADLSSVDPGDHQRRIDEWVRAEKERGFDLDAHPLIRFMIHRLDDQTFQFTYGFHHEIVDGWSEALMVTELFTHYFSEVFGEKWVPTPPASSMRDAVALELEALRRPEDLAFWTEYLDGASLMRLPRLDVPLGADTGARDIVRIPVEVGRQLSDGLKALATSRSMPLKNVLLAAHMAVMNHYHGQPDTLSYTVTNGRPEEVDGSSAIGLFVNSLALRLRMHGGSWTDLVADTLDAERRTMPYRRLPMAELKRHQGSEPLAETLFFFTDYHVFHALDRWRDRGVRHEASELYGESTFPFCAIFRTNRESGELEIRVEYDGLQFTADLMDRVAACYRRVLDRMVQDPDAAYDADSLLSAEERRLVIDRVNGPGDALDDGSCMHQVIRRQAERTPDRIAVVGESGQLTYAGLVRAADGVAASLRAAGVGPEDVVGLLAEPGVDAVVAILGILGSGAGYLPLDPAQPAARLAALVEAAGASLVLAPAEGDLSDLPVRRLTRSQYLSAATGGDRAPDVALSPESAAYLIFTSGSTGAPKGVVVSHRALVSSTAARTTTYPSDPEHFLLLSSLAVDSSVAGLFWTLARGGTLHSPPAGSRREPAVLAGLIARHGITHTLAVPALLSALLARREQTWARSLQHVIAAGDVAPRQLQEELRRIAPQSVLHNEYGPTETCVWSTHFSGDADGFRAALPIGSPVPGARVYPLDGRLHPVPLGVTAELHIGGAHVARGYHRDPGRTAAAFLPDPHAGQPGRRMYRTGDLVRATREGPLEFLGRSDNQVKIRGYRVELSEVETVLEQRADVQRAVVVARPDAGGDARLHAYVVTVQGADVDAASVLRHVRDRLPASMVPSDVTVVDALPLTPTGKLDRSALPAPSAATGAGAAWVAPATPTEELVAAIWSRVLGVERVGGNDDFFGLGGESLRAMHVINRVNAAFLLELPVRSLFDAPTLAAFAGTVDRTLRESGDPGRPHRVDDLPVGVVAG